jgi:dUTP pyrophosphatase
MGLDKKSSTWSNIKDMVFDGGSNMSDEMVLNQLGVDKKTMAGIEQAAKEQAMEDIKVRVKFVNHSDNEDPKHKHLDDSGMDLRANLPDGDITIRVGKIQLVPTGLHFELPESMEIQVRPRSGLAAKNGITVLNTPGTVDRGYTGEIKIILINLGDKNFLIEHGDRVAQAVISPVISGRWSKIIKVDSIGPSKRGNGGFGSTGIN